MRLALLAAPAELPVSLREIRDQLRIDHLEEDELLDGLIRTAVAALDGRSGLLGRCLLAQSWRLTLERFGDEIALPLPPCRTIDEIRFTDPRGLDTLLAPSAYRVIGLGDEDGATLLPASGGAWPAASRNRDAVRISFTAGYGDEPRHVPEPLVTAIKQHVAYLYENRGDSGRSPPPAWGELVFPFRVAGV